jgi:polyhydroxyalkanoate synthesis regulator phasin
VIDIVRDYAAIGMGTAQAATTRVAGVGRDAVGAVIGLAQVDPAALPLANVSVDPRGVASHGREAVRGLLAGDVDGVINRLGLVKKSELHAVRAQLHRLERRLGDVRGER